MNSKLLLPLFVALFALPLSAQNLSDNSPEVLYSSNNLKITYRLQTCIHPTSPNKEQLNFYFLTIKNTSNQSATITFRLEAYDGDQCISCMAGDPQIYTYTIKPGQTMQPNCKFEQYTSLMINKNYNASKPASTIDKIKITNISLR